MPHRPARGPIDARSIAAVFTGSPAKKQLRAGAVWGLTMLLAMSSSAQQAQARDEALELKFADFFVQPVGPRGLTIADALRAADGRRVRLVGYMVSQEQPMPGQFMLTPRPVRISEHADGEASDLPPATVLVILDERQRDRVIAHQPGLIALAGRLEVGRAEDPCGRVSWVRLRLDPKSIADDGLDGPPDKQASAMDPRPATPQQ